MRIELVWAPSSIRFQPIPPLGISTLAAALRSVGHFVEQKDLELECVELTLTGKWTTWKSDLAAMTNRDRVNRFVLENASDVEIQRGLSATQSLLPCDEFDIIGFSVMSMRQFWTSLLLARSLKKNERPKIVFGGEFVTRNGETILRKYEFVDFCLSGHSFKSFPWLIDFLQSNEKDSPQIPGLVYRSHGNPVSNKQGPIQIDDMPIPDFDGFSLQKYPKIIDIVFDGSFDTLLLRYLLSTGCPFDCVFCGRHVRAHPRLKDPPKIVKELCSLSRKYQTKLFCLECNEVNPSRKWLSHLCDEFEEKRLNLQWYAYAVPRDLDKESLNRLYFAGCRVLRFGMESGSQRILNLMNKPVDVSEAEAILKHSSEIGFWNHVNFIVGFPSEEKTDIQETVEFIKRNRKFIDSIKMSPFYVDSESSIFDSPERYGLRITQKTIDRIEFSEKNREWPQIMREVVWGVREIYQIMKDSEISSAGSATELVFVALTHFNNKETTKRWLKEKHPYFLDNIPSQRMIAKLYNPDERKLKETDELWHDFVGRWGGSFDVI